MGNGKQNQNQNPIPKFSFLQNLLKNPTSKTSKIGIQTTRSVHSILKFQTLVEATKTSMQKRKQNRGKKDPRCQGKDGPERLQWEAANRERRSGLWEPNVQQNEGKKKATAQSQTTAIAADWPWMDDRVHILDERWQMSSIYLAHSALPAVCRGIVRSAEYVRIIAYFM